MLWRFDRALFAAPTHDMPLARAATGSVPVPAGLHASWKDVSGDWRWANFEPQELACRCGGRFCAGEYWHDPLFLDSLQRLREALGAPVRINSGHRDPLWNAHVGGAPRSEHKTLAADVSLRGHEPGRMLAAARDAGFTSFGLYGSFVHMDLRPGRRWFGSAAAQRAWALVLATPEGESAWKR